MIDLKGIVIYWIEQAEHQMQTYKYSRIVKKVRVHWQKDLTNDSSLINVEEREAEK